MLPGFVLPAGSADRPLETLAAAMEPCYRHLTVGWHRLIVRSSSGMEDTATSSMAGQFRSVAGVDSWERFMEAVQLVIDSAVEPGGGPQARQDMAVLVQQQLTPVKSGVLFGADPVTGGEDRLVVAVVAGGPAALVSGEVDGDRYSLDRRGWIIEHRPGEGGAPLRRGERRALAELASRSPPCSTDPRTWSGPSTSGETSFSSSPGP